MEFPACIRRARRYPRAMSNRTVVLAAAVAIVVAAGLYIGYAASQRRRQQQHVKELVVDTTQKLRQVLAAKSSPDVAAALDANLKSARAPRDPKLPDPAEHYTPGAREFARRRTEVDPLPRQSAASRHALAAHMANAAHRGTSWLNEAIVLKKRVEDDHFNLSLE